MPEVIRMPHLLEIIALVTAVFGAAISLFRVRSRLRRGLGENAIRFRSVSGPESIEITQDMSPDEVMRAIDALKNSLDEAHRSAVHGAEGIEVQIADQESLIGKYEAAAGVHAYELRADLQRAKARLQSLLEEFRATKRKADEYADSIKAKVEQQKRTSGDEPL